MKKYIFTALLLSNLAFSQTSVSEISQKFNNEKIEFSLPISPSENIKILWKERPSSFSSQGIRSFIGYIDNQAIGVLSLYQNHISGEISWQGKSYRIDTQKGNLMISEAPQGICQAPEHQHHHKKISTFSHNQTMATSPTFDEVPDINTDGVLRVYRLAHLVDYGRFVEFGQDINRIKQFWAETETFLNELYTRDLGIRFQIIDNEKLIIKDADIFKGKTSDFITDNSTKKINELIGEKNYEIGVVSAMSSSNLNGSAGQYFAYNQSTKAAAYAIMKASTIAHEVGHLFGGTHTFSEGGSDTMNTEPGRGQSIMGYSRTLPRDFFGLPNIREIRRAIQNNANYYTDEARTNFVGHRNDGNFPYGIPFQNQPPIINRNKLKAEYTLPQDSYFQFVIKATDPDNDPLLYTAHQADIRLKQLGYRAIVRSMKPSLNNVVPFYPEYQVNGNSVSLVEASAPPAYANGKYSFWLGVNDGGTLLENPKNNHAPQYDVVETKVNFVSGTPFKITEGVKKIYNAGEKVKLKWSVDHQIFNGTKVRILMSDDFGKTWKYVLNPSTENNGEAEISIPNIEVGKFKHSDALQSGAGLFKIEILDHIAVAISDNHPQTGGFEVRKSAISFENLPPQHLSAKENAIPEKADVKAISSCETAQNPLQINYTQTKDNQLIIRIWTASDSCGNTASFTQYISVEKSVAPLHWVGHLPENTHIQCIKDYSEPATLNVEGGTSPIINLTQTRVQGNYDNYTLKRTWIATDPDADPISHTQTLIFFDNQKPVFQGVLPENKVVKSWSEVPLMLPLTAVDNCDGNVKVEMEQRTELDENNPNIFITRYIWTAVDLSGNENQYVQQIIMNPTLSTSESAKKHEITLYPNPANDSFQLNIEHPKSVKIFDVSGKIVKTFGKQEKYNISDLPKGVFIVVVETDKGNEHLKLIKQ